MKKLFLLMTLVAAAQTGSHTVTVNWTDTLNPVGTKYNVKRGSGTCASNPVFTTIAPGVAAKTYNDVGIITGIYCYTLSATNGPQESGNAMGSTATVTLFTPQNVTVTITDTVVP